MSEYIFISSYIASVVVSLGTYVYTHWANGHDLDVAEASSMAVLAAIPVLNLLIAIGFALKAGHKITLLAGRKK
jgi:hypothetical protein|tara:strand:- start:1235 stop:1456 length:222 start_codon:yes stop_codon:yes gene_type:complete